MTVSAASKDKVIHLIKDDLGLPFSAAELEKIFQGDLVRSSMETLTERELAAAFVVLLPKTPEEVESIFLENQGKEDSDESIQQLVNSSKSEHGGDDELTLDFSTLRLLPAKSATTMVTQYTNPKSYGDLNLSSAESALFHGLKHPKADEVEETLRKVLAKRLEDYQQKGLEGIAPYQRGKSHFEPGKELLERCQKLKLLHKMAPELAKYIIEYPNSKPSTGTVKESFCWMSFSIDEKPTFSLVHKVLYKRGDLFFVFHRHFYVSRGHNSVQAVGGGLSVKEKDDTSGEASTLLLFASRTSTDQVSGFGGSTKRALGSRIMGEKLAKNLTAWKKKIDQE